MCHIYSVHGQTCLDCLRKTPLDGLFAATPYKHPLVSKSVHAYKYRFVETLAEPLTELLREELLNHELPLPDILVPVPLHVRRLRWRGFNQAERIAQYLSLILAPGCPIPIDTNRLIRSHATLPQAKTTSKTKRLENLRGAFVWNDHLSNTQATATRQNITNARVWLVDDVATTLATLEECAAVLKRAGAREVMGIVIAH